MTIMFCVGIIREATTSHMAVSVSETLNFFTLVHFNSFKFQQPWG